MREAAKDKSKRREIGRRLHCMRAAHIWREGALPRRVRRYLKERFPAVCHS
jgi:hypothetical protein